LARDSIARCDGRQIVISIQALQVSYFLNLESGPGPI
jgi:hypothetical protein